METFIPPMSFWVIMLGIVLLCLAAYFFGLFDTFIRGGPKLFLALVGVVVFYVFCIVVLYISFALCHKYIGPFIFGG